MSATFAALLALDERLAEHGVPPLSDWWRVELERFYEHPTARTLAVCAGRGAAKSTALYKVALAETLFGDFVVPPGERHWASLTSRLREEAGKATDIIAAWLRMLSIRHTASDGLIELADMPRGVRITAASVGGNTGWRSYFDGSDEVGKWPTEGAMAVDGGEVLASKRAMTATHPTARHMIVSTPFVDSGPFHELVMAGDCEHTLVAGPAPTWTVAPHISEAQTRRLEPNERVHAREYGASFAVEWSHGYFAGLIEPCIQPWSALAYEPRHRYVVALDPAFARDLFAIVVAHAEHGIVFVDRVEAITPHRGGPGLVPSACLRAVRDLSAEYGTHEALSDQFSAASLTELATAEGLHLSPITWTATNKTERFDLVRVLMRDGRLRLPDDDGLRRELGGIGTRLLSSGTESIQARYGYTDDRVAAMVLAVAEVAGDLASSAGSRGMSISRGGRWGGAFFGTGRGF